MREGFEEKLKTHKRFVTSYNLNEDHRMFVFSFEDNFKQSVVSPFLAGKYSKIDRDYVNMFFPREIISGITRRPSMNWMILNKSPKIREQWEDILDVSLPEDAEVWSRPLETEEIHEFKKSA